MAQLLRLTILLPAKDLGKASGDDPSVGAPDAYVGGLAEAPGSWL